MMNNQLPTVICLLTSDLCHLSFTTVEKALQIDPFMQNKANFQKSQVNVNLYNTTDYENKHNWTLGENKPKTNPIKANFRKAKMNINKVLTKDYENEPLFRRGKNKPKTNPKQTQFQTGPFASSGVFT